ncbi:hypothetical protein [Kaarinaea lacus]
MNHEYELLEKNKRDIQYQFNVSITLAFLLAILIYSGIFLKKEKQEAGDVVAKTTEEVVAYYFDTLVTLMLTGQMDSKEIIRQKILLRPGVNEVRLVRNPELFELVSASQQPQDELDEKALKRGAGHAVSVNEKSRILSIAAPLVATENTRKVNCLVCHMVQSGEVLGVIRLDYSLSQSDRKIMERFYTHMVALVIIFLMTISVANIYVSKKRLEK